jgi:hypothetical protein
MEINNPVTGKRVELSESQFNSYMAQTNGAVLDWIVEPIRKHGSHNQKTHGGKGGGSGSGSAALEYPTRKSNPELAYPLKEYVVQYPEGMGHAAINQTLRGRAQREAENFPPVVSEDLDSKVAALDKLVEISPALPEDTVVYRGIGGAFAMELDNKGVGATFTDAGFTSVSLDRSIARGFPSRPSGNVMEIVLPKGTKAINPSKFFTSGKIGGTELRREKELILGRGTTFEILSIEDNPFSLGSNYKIGIKQ